MSGLHVVAILDTMWGEPGDAPPWFKISPENHSGRRLYKLVGPDAMLMVTNSCRERVSCASEHGTPDPEWLAENLECLQDLQPIVVLLVCGEVARSTYGRVLSRHGRLTSALVIETPHPASRSGWTKEYIAKLQSEIAEALKVAA